ncbi:alpha/beta hydrolase fold protein [Tanacetum coccineum]
MHLVKDDGTTGLLDNGIRAMLMGCRKLERLDISLRHGGLTDVGLAYIEKYGVNLSEQVVASYVFNIPSLRKCALLEHSCSTILADGDCIVIHTLSAGDINHIRKPKANEICEKCSIHDIITQARDNGLAT